MSAPERRIAGLRLRQRDGVTCGPSVAIVGAALLDPGYGQTLHDEGWFADEQGRLHRWLNRLWPRALGTTPAGIRRALSRHSAVAYRWRISRCRRDRLLDVREAVLLGYPVAFSIAANGLLFGVIGIATGLLEPSIFQALPERVFGIMFNETLLAIPFFTLMGAILERSGLAEDLLEGFGQLFGGIRGGLSYAVILVGAVLGAILVNNEAFYRVSDFLEPKHFFEPIHQQIFEVAGSLIRAGKIASPVTLRRKARSWLYFPKHLLAVILRP